MPGRGPGAIIAIVAYFVGQPVEASMVMVGSRLRQARCDGQTDRIMAAGSFRWGIWILRKA